MIKFIIFFWSTHLLAGFDWPLGGECEYNPIAPWTVKKTGCDCGDFFITNTKPDAGSHYCSEDKLVMCTDEDVIPSEHCVDPKDGGTRFCKEKKCHECLEKKDCNSPDPKNTTACSDGKYYEQTKGCVTCRDVIGNGGDNIVFVPGKGISLEDLESLALTVASYEPFTMLLRENKISFKIAYGHMGEKILFPNATPQTSADLGEFNYETKTKFEQDVIDYGVEVCSSTFTILVTEQGAGKLGYAYPKIFGFPFLISQNSPLDIAHEMGHGLANLGDEYYNNYYDPDEQINVKPAHYDDVFGESCPDFDKYVSRPNCLPIFWWSKHGEWQNATRFRVTTPLSLMGGGGNDFPAFNIMSCAGVLNEVGGDGIPQAVQKCTQMSQTCKVLKQDGSCF